ncbi:MAG: SDR family oxidoreductase [Planctomycetia bacterium]|nr:SDR family oxidoreductase [Planctomycetia bacterium]
MPTSLVSGGSRGLGLAVVERLLGRGDRVATFSRSGSESLARLGAAHPGRLHAELLDAADAGAVRAFVGRVAAAFGSIDHCIANAAVAHEGVLATMADAEIDAMLAVNLRGAIVLVREVVRQMLVGAEGPSITLVSSVVAAQGGPGLAVYAATKAALEGFARSLARELGPRGIRVNAVAPGFLDTDLSASLPEEHRARIVRRTPLGRLGLPADVVGAIDFLSSPRAGFITGQVLTIAGGA